jgi:hypothetical protein
LQGADWPITAASRRLPAVCPAVCPDGLSRRAALSRLAAGGGLLLARHAAGVDAPRYPLEVFRPGRADRRLLDELERTALAFFRERAHPVTGHVLDRARADGEADSRGIASIAATGFGLTVLCLGHARGHAPKAELEAQVRRTLRFLHDRQPQHRGFFFHFVDWADGERVWDCELSSIDSTLLMLGVLTCRAHFDGDAEIRRLATALYERMDWPWFLNGGDTVSMGWKPEDGFLKSRWDHYCELKMLYLLGLASPAHPLPERTWRAWTRPVQEHEGERFVFSPAPLFVHQFSHAWFDFRHTVDDGVDWFANSVATTRAHLRWSLRRRDRFPKWGEDLWGVTSSDSEKGYAAWGGPPDMGPLDGTIVPCAAAGSLPFLPRECLRTLHHQRDAHAARVWRRHGFVDAWNPHTDWNNPDILGIDVGITALMGANLRDGWVWKTFGRDPAAREGMRRAGFRAT